MSVLLGAVGLAMLYWGVRGVVMATRSPGPRVAPPRSRAVQRERDLLSLRERFATSDMSTEEFEREVEARLAPERVVETGNPTGVPATSGVAWEVHVHDAPPGHSLHLHLS